jgi:RNA polymerase sigma-70 factor (ECF subfamily)
MDRRRLACRFAGTQILELSACLMAILKTMTEREPQELLDRIAEADEDAFLELYNAWQGAVYRFAWQMTGSTSMADDIVQDVFLLMIRKKLHYDPRKGAFSSFIYGVARNLALKSLRKNQRFAGIFQFLQDRRESRTSATDPLSNLTEAESAVNLRKCILTLPTQYREMIVLCDLHELTYAEAAEITGCAIGTVRSRLHRGRELLLHKLRSEQNAGEKRKGETPYEIPTL